MKRFTASDALALSTAINQNEYTETIERIRSEAQKGRRGISIYNSPLREATLLALKEDGFNVSDAPSIAVQKEGIYHSITW